MRSPRTRLLSSSMSHVLRCTCPWSSVLNCINTSVLRQSDPCSLGHEALRSSQVVHRSSSTPTAHHARQLRKVRRHLDLDEQAVDREAGHSDDHLRGMVRTPLNFLDGSGDLFELRGSKRINRSTDNSAPTGTDLVEHNLDVPHGGFRLLTEVTHADHREVLG